MQAQVAEDITQVKVSSLREHPRQREFFSPPSAQELEVLAASMAIKQKVPIECTASGIIICGHRRVAAAKLLDWTHIAARVRHDAEDANSRSVVLALIADNVERAQLDELAMARCYKEMKKLVGGRAAA